MPTEDYSWNETGVDIMLINKDTNETVLMKNITGFFKMLEVDGLGEGNIKKIIKTGNNTIGKIIGMSIDDFMMVEGFKEKMATKIYNSIHKQIDKASLSSIAAASNIFSRGFGQKKIDLILKTEPKILTEVISIEEKINKLKNIEGLGDKTSRAFAEKIKDFMIFIKEAKLEYKLDEKVSSEKVSSEKVSSNKVLSNKIIVLSDLKDKKGITEKIVELGGEVVGNINKSVNLLVVGDIDTETGKMKKAKEYNISIISIDDFKNKYISE